MRVATLLAFLAGVGPAFAQGVAATPSLPQQGSEAVDVAAIVDSHYPQTMALLAAEFPADHALLKERLDQIDARAGTERQLMLAVARELTDLRRRYADRLLFAPTVTHREMMTRLAAFYDRVHRIEGPEVCGRFAADGSAVLFDLGLSASYANLLDAQSVAYFEAVVGAIEAPEYGGVVTSDDWNVLMARMIEAGVPPSFAATVAGGKPDDPNLCPALAAMFLASALLDTPEGVRTRADLARNLTGY
jgi:hypothetical protein